MAKRREYTSGYSNTGLQEEHETLPPAKYDGNDFQMEQKTLAPAIDPPVLKDDYFAPAIAKEDRVVSSYRALERNVAECLGIVDDMVMRSYITKLSDLEIVDPRFDEEKMGREPYQFFRITELVYERDEFSVSKLAAVFQAVSGKNCTLVLLVKNHDHVSDFYFGVRNHDDKDFTGTFRQMLEMGLKGQFPGTSFDESFSSVEDMGKITSELRDSTKSVSSVSCIPGFKQEKDFFENKDFLQGLEKFVLSMQDKDYTAVFVADTVPYDDLSEYRRQLESVYTRLSSFTNMQFQISSSEGNSRSKTSQTGRTESRSSGTTDSETENRSESEGFSDGWSRGIGSSKTTGVSHSTGTSTSVSDGSSRGRTVTDGTSKTETKGTTSSINLGIPFLGGVSFSRSKSTSYGESHSVSLSDVVSKTLTQGVSESDSTSSSDSVSSNESVNHGENSSKTFGTSSMHGTTSSYSESFNFGCSETLADSFGSSHGITVRTQNMTIDNMLDRIKRQIQRIDEAESLGMWNCAAYFMSEETAISETAARMYHSLVSGKSSGVERSAVNTWSSGEDVGRMKSYLTHFCHPRFSCRMSGGFSALVTPASLVSTKELALQMSLPRKSVCGLPVIEHADFGKEVVRYAQKGGGRGVSLGRVFNMGRGTSVTVDLDRDSLAMHTFITGSTGSGKSNAIYEILSQLRRMKVPFLVVEPAKGEYKNVFGQFKDVSVYGTNPKKSSPLKINPFRFPEDIHVLEHLDRLVEIFNVCWPMYAAMPAILKEAMERAYVSAGWDIRSSVNPKGARYPNFKDLLREIEKVLEESKYSADSKGDYSGALMTRVRSLTNGLNGMIFCNDDLEDEDLFDRNVIVDLSRVASSETKALIMGLLVARLNEYRMTSGKMNSPLSHVTVLEEAHNILRRTPTEQVSEGSNLLGKSVEMLANSIAEMRTYGEGFIIADQSPGLMDMSVIRNTNTKIILRLPDKSDRELAGYSAGLREDQIDELSKLKRGVAAVYQNDWVEPVLVQISKCDIEEMDYKYSGCSESFDLSSTRAMLIDFLINGRVGSADKRRFSVEDIDEIERRLGSLELSTSEQDFIEQEILYYRENGSASCWKDRRFRALSKMVVDILEVRGKVEKAVLNSSDNDELMDALGNIVKDAVPNQSDGQILALSHCMMKDMSLQESESEVRKSIYGKWYDSVVDRARKLV